MIDDPYKVLGISRNATDAEIKKAYLALVKKYHPDKYQGNPLADLAEEKLQEVNEAYDMLKNGSGANAAGAAYGTSSYAGNYAGSGRYMQIRQALDSGQLAMAEQMLIAVKDHDAEWYFLSGVLSFKKGYVQDGMANVQTAMNMDPNNQEYRSIYQQMSGYGNIYQRRSDGYGYGQGQQTADMLSCAALPLCFCGNPFCLCC